MEQRRFSVNVEVDALRFPRGKTDQSHATTGLWREIETDESERLYRFGTHRTVPPAVTLSRIKPLLARAGITRLADVTGLDCVGVPVYQAVRHNSRNLSVSQGKGLTRAQAKVSALMEALENFHAEEIRQPSMWANVGEMRRTLGYDPHRLDVSQPGTLTDETLLEWTEATDLEDGRRTWIPRQLCELDRSIVDRLSVPLFSATSNGLASGNTISEALIHGLCEVVERDSLWRYRESPFDPVRSVSHETIYPRLARRLLERFTRARLRTHISDMSGPTGLPCYQVWIDHPDAPGRYWGAGCHPSRLTALIRALTEAAQSRLTHIAGSRDDITRKSYQHEWTPSGAPLRPPFPDQSMRRFGEGPSLPASSAPQQLWEIIRRVRRVTGTSPIAVNLSRPEFGLPVVFVAAPGLRFDIDV